MNISNIHKNKVGYLNKAEELRQQKLKRIEDTNMKISKQLDRSADTWKTSMEQIRKIAKKSQDSSQILDNVFTENDNDRSDVESEFPKGRTRSLMGDSPYYHTNPPYYGPFRPTSQHAFFSSNYLHQGLQPRMYHGIHPFNSDINLKASQHIQSMNQSNSSNFSQTPTPRYVYNRPINPYQVELNQSNSAMVSPFPPFVNYNPNFPRPSSFYPPLNYPTVVPTNPNYFQQPQMFHPFVNQYRPYPPPKDNNGLESMKKYVNTLLDKLERLNDTVAQLKNQNQNRHHVRECSHNRDQMLTPNPGYYENISYHPPYCCSHKVHVPQTSRACSCWGLQQSQVRRPQSSMSDNPYHKTPCNCKPNRLVAPPTNPYSHNCNASCSQHKPPRTYREANIPSHRRQESELPFTSSQNHYGYGYSHHQTVIPSQYVKPSFVRPQTPSTLADTSNSLPGVALVVDNSNNNNLSHVLVASHDLTGDLSSLSELPDATM